MRMYCMVQKKQKQNEEKKLTRNNRPIEEENICKDQQHMRVDDLVLETGDGFFFRGLEPPPSHNLLCLVISAR